MMVKVKSLLVATLFIGGTAVPAGVAQAYPGDEGGTPGAPAGMAQMHGGMMGGWMLLWALVGIALLVVAVLAAVRLVRHRTPARPDEAISAQELLRRRYAAGEIDREQYLRAHRDLSGG